jgi:hypothetical protein
MQRLITILLRGTSKFASALQDNIVIFSNTWPEHCDHIREILKRLKEANLTASISKCEFAMKRLDILGWSVEAGEIKPCQKHVDAILKMAPQKTKKGVRALVGLVGYYRSLIPNLAHIIHDLTELLKRDQPDKNIHWQQCHTDALNEIKRIMTSKPVLVPPIFDGRGYILATDATITSVAGCLLQKDDQGVERNIGYFSKKLLPSQRKWSVLELECYGILTGCLKFHEIVYGFPILARTDHRSLEFLDSLSQSNSRVARWRIILSNYNLTTQYRPAAEHANCDGLSRVEMMDD